MASDTSFQHLYNIKGGDFINAGESSCEVRNTLKNLGIEPNIVRRVAIASYEAEMNVVMYANEGTMRFIVTPKEIRIVVKDSGQGIPNIKQAMQPGFSTATKEMREMGFGAGMGLPNIKKNADVFNIYTTKGKGTTLEITIFLNNHHE